MTSIPAAHRSGPPRGGGGELAPLAPSLLAFGFLWLALTVPFFVWPSLQVVAAHATASLLALCLNRFHVMAAVEGATVTFQPNEHFTIISECTAFSILTLFAAAVLATPVGWGPRCLALGWGIPLILLANLVRLLWLAWVDVHWPSTFDLWHLYLWQATFSAIVVAAFWLWFRTLSRAAGEMQGGVQ